MAAPASPGVWISEPQGERLVARRRPFYRFIERYRTAAGVDYYVWHAFVPGDSRMRQVSCRVAWFWGPKP
jgi:hypothetical protein